MKKKNNKNISKLDQLFLDAQKKVGVSNTSIKKMREYLKKKGGSKKEIDEVIAKLKKYLILDEDEVIRNVISYCETKHYGYKRIIMMLKQREIDPRKISLIVKDDTRELKEASIMKNRLIKRYKSKNTANLKQSVYSALIRYGYDENIANSLISDIHNSYQEEINMLILEYNKVISSYSRNYKGNALKVKLIEHFLTKGYKYSYIRKVMENHKYEMD